MITLTFEEFRRGDYDDREEFHELYVLRRGDEVLYVGISARGAWMRWFGWNGHITRNGWGEDLHTSSAGRAVIEHAPESNKWLVELWTIEDCARLFIGDEFEPFQMPLRRAENLMIERRRPVLNVTNAPYHKPIFE